VPAQILTIGWLPRAVMLFETYSQIENKYFAAF
jgi:hypothetical protein